MTKPLASVRHGIPELRNTRYLETFRAGQQARVDAFTTGKTDELPLYSHNQTYQSLFRKGWESLTHVDLLRVKAKREQHKEAPCCH